jgi:uncharacterized protein GlcG (DUF336 family)
LNQKYGADFWICRRTSDILLFRFLDNGKAWTAVNFARATSDLIDAIKSGELTLVTATLPKVTMLAGGLIIEAGGSLLGSVGLAGALGGEKDEACARAGIAAVRDKLDL